MLTAVERIPLESYFHSATNNFGSYVVGLAEGQYHPDALNWNGNIFHFIFALALNVYFCSIWLFHTSRTIYIGHRYRSFMLNSTGRLRILLYVTSANTHENRQKCHVHSKYWQIIQPDPQHVLTTAQLIGWNTVLAFNSFVSTAKLPFIHQCVPSIGQGAATCCKENLHTIRYKFVASLPCTNKIYCNRGKIYWIWNNLSNLYRQIRLQFLLQWIGQIQIRLKICICKWRFTVFVYPFV